MRTIKKPLCFLIFALVVNHYSFGQVVDFESINIPVNNGNGHALLNSGFSLAERCSVHFHLCDPDLIQQGVDLINSVVTAKPNVVETGGSTPHAYKNDGHVSSYSCYAGNMDNLSLTNSGGVQNCQFLTDELGLSTASNMHALLIEYPLDPVQFVSGDIMDVDDNGTSNKCEAWIIEAYDPNFIKIATEIIASDGCQQLAAISGHNGSPTGDGIPSRFEIDLSGTANAISYVVIRYHPSATRTTDIGLAFDNFHSGCSTPEACLNGNNHIHWGRFHNSGAYDWFYSDYAYSSIDGHLPPGMLNISTPSDGREFCENWNYKSTDCNDDNPSLIVNGLTNGNGLTRVIGFGLNLIPNGRYQVCYDAKRLENCCFDLAPPALISRVTQFLGGNLLNETNLIMTDPDDPCDWGSYANSFCVSNNGWWGFVYIELLHDSDPYQDGSDFVLDNLKVKHVGTCGQTVRSLQEERSFDLQEGTIYPNPTNGMLKIELPEKVIGQTISFALFDVSGRLVVQEQILVQTPIIQKKLKESISNGTYIVKIIGEDFSETKKIEIVR